MPVTRTIDARGPFDYAASRRFFRGFAAVMSSAAETSDVVLAFPSDDGFAAAGVAIRPTETGIHLDIEGDVDADTVANQVARMLSLHTDATDYAAVIGKDPVLTEIVGRIGMLRPVLFSSPWEAAAWAVISTRDRIVHAAKVKADLAKELGTQIEVGGQQLHAFPSPDALVTMDRFPGLSDRKVDFLNHLAHAALQGDLDASRLSDMCESDAFAHLKRIRGIGDYGATLIILRGLGTQDRLPSEVRFVKAFSTAYGINHPNHDTITAITDTWRPWRTWVSVLIRASLDDLTHVPSMAPTVTDAV